MSVGLMGVTLVTIGSSSLFPFPVFKLRFHEECWIVFFGCRCTYIPLFVIAISPVEC